MEALPESSVETWYPHIQAVLRNWPNKPLPDEASQSLITLQLVRERLAGISENTPLLQRLMINEVLMAQLKLLEKQNPQHGEILHRRYLDGESGQAVAATLQTGRDVFMRERRKAIKALTALVMQAEQAARERRIRQLESCLDSRTYQQLFGVEDALTELVEMVLTAGSLPVIVLVGMGGLGKTALADAVSREVIRHFCFEQVLWIRVGADKADSAPAGLTADTLMTRLAQKLVPQLPSQTPVQQRDEQVRYILKTLPHLVVIDNLESSEASDHWTGLLRELAGPSKFLLTSRTRLADPAGVYHYPLRELSLEDGTELIRHHARSTGTSDLAEASAEQVQAIYDIVGGNPLALKLVVSLLPARPMDTILGDLRQAYTPKIESLYQRIYWQAWRTLTPEAQQLLRIMPVASYMGMDPSQMQRLSKLTEAELWPAVDELVRRSLLEVWNRGDQRRYAVHRLTESFLQTSIIGWSPNVL